MAPVPDGASELPRSKPKTASPKRFAWRLYPFTTTSPTWATITALNAPATVPSKPPRTPLINSPASFIISLKLGSLMMKLFLQSLKLVTKNTVCTSYKLSLGKWVTHSCRPMRDPQFLERGMSKIQLQGELYLPALVNGIGDLSESGHGQLYSGFIELRRVEEVNNFRTIVE